MLFLLTCQVYLKEKTKIYIYGYCNVKIIDLLVQFYLQSKFWTIIYISSSEIFADTEQWSREITFKLLFLFVIETFFEPALSFDSAANSDSSGKLDNLFSIIF